MIDNDIQSGAAVMERESFMGPSTRGGPAGNRECRNPLHLGEILGVSFHFLTGGKRWRNILNGVIT